MTENDGYQRMLDDFGAQLDGVAASARPGRGTVAAGGAVLAGIGAGVLVLTGTGGSHLDVVAQAKAALAPAGQIVHLVTTQHLEFNSGDQPDVFPGPSVSEQWFTSTNGPRWRTALTVPDPDSGPNIGRQGDPHGPIVGPEQFSYANGTGEFYVQQRNTLDVTTGYSDDGPGASVPSLAGNDPMVEARSMLDAGQLRDAGNAVVDGKAVRRLVGTEHPSSSRSWPIEYDVDPSTYAPVRITITMNFPRLTRVVVDVDTYERLPLNDDTARLLTIQPVGDPTVFNHRATDPPDGP